MLIECKIQRPGGTVVELFGRDYHFKPDAFGRHICDVADERAAARFLEISEGYERAAARAAGPVKVNNPPPSAAAAAPPTDVPAGAPANIDQMNRVEMMAYGKRLGVRLPANLSDEKMRLNLALALRERAEADDAPAVAPADDVSDLT